MYLPYYQVILTKVCRKWPKSQAKPEAPLKKIHFLSIGSVLQAYISLATSTLFTDRETAAVANISGWI